MFHEEIIFYVFSKKSTLLGTIGLEIVEQCEGADAIVVPVGGGGLIAGIATAVKTLSPNTKIIASYSSFL